MAWYDGIWALECNSLFEIYIQKNNNAICFLTWDEEMNSV